jgi:capsular exopolysaccharide synthesis family protein
MMVTSAMGGEGKTSLSCHLATSLARAGFRTVLIDADLRNPSVDQVFDIPCGPGLSELLRGETVIEQTLVPSTHPDLTVIPAGECDEGSVRGLSRGRLQPIFERLRERFEFVVVDSAPILPVADTLAIAPNVDAVILSALRDVSRLPKVFAAYQRLGLLGVRILGAVVTGVHGGLYGTDYHYQYPYPGRSRTRTNPVKTDVGPAAGENR